MLHERTRIDGGVAHLTLTRGYVAMIDACDAQDVGRYAWAARVTPWGVYAARFSARPERALVWLHRHLLCAPKGLLVDHKDGDGLNNRRSNLRLATYGQNAMNSRPRKGSKSGLKGAYWWDGRWFSAIQVGGVKRHLGFFRSAEEAHAAYCRAAKELHGEFARFA